MHTKLLLLAQVGALVSPVMVTDLTLYSFKQQHLERFYWSEGAALGDLNRVGKPDAVCGPYWWEGPDFTQRHELYAPAKTTAVKTPDGSSRTFVGWHGGMGNANAYSNDNFFTFVHDFNVNGDGRPDIIIGNKKGAFVFTNQAAVVAPADWEKAQPPVLFPDAEKNFLTARDVITPTPRASDAPKADRGKAQTAPKK